MSLDNIELQDLILAELYKDHLVAGSATSLRQPSIPPVTPPRSAPSAVPVTSSAATTAPPASASSGYKFLGNNRRKITILVDSPGTAFLPDDHLTFLTKILEACQMNIGDVAIVNHAQSPVIVTELRRQLQPAVILLFGVDPVAIKLPIQFPVFKQQAYDQCTYVSAPTLKELVQPTQEGKLLKSKLWVTLKTLFNV
jgi:hypothetical protein